MADIVDLADGLIEKTLEEALSNIPRYTGISAKECEECGEDIPEGRRLALPGVRLCTACSYQDWLVKQGVKRI